MLWTGAEFKTVGPCTHTYTIGQNGRLGADADFGVKVEVIPSTWADREGSPSDSDSSHDASGLSGSHSCQFSGGGGQDGSGRQPTGGAQSVGGAVQFGSGL
ncbi:hypothetical protein Kisp02_04220 [Kineosporia sp. NBRC 101731]|nr:hypothetical protein Kisp02_04220 [Kineosporia sp. NBRC 101731]